MNTSHSESFAVRRTSRRLFLTSAVTAIVAVLALGITSSALADKDDRRQHWVASWSTATAAFFVYAAPAVQNQAAAPNPARFATANIQPDLAFPFPNATTTGATAVNQTFRSIVKPDLWGDTMRVRFSNVFGNVPLTFSSVTIALQEYAANVVHDTVTAVKFGGSHSVTVPAGAEMWSDAVHLRWAKDADDPLLQGRNLAISYSVRGDSGHMSFHSGANTTSYITGNGTGDHTYDEDGFAYEYTTASWFFVNAVDVMAPGDTVVVCAFGDSITDGTHTTFNGYDRWSNVLSRRLHNAYGNKISVVNEAIGGNRVINPAVVNATSGPAAVDRLDRDVLGLSGLTHVIWLEGINDLGAGFGPGATENPVVHTPQNIIAGYQNVVSRLHQRGIKVYGATVVSALGLNNPAEGWDLINFPTFLATGDNGPVVEAGRLILNQFIRTPGNFDGVVDFDGATRDPDPASRGNMRPKFLPNSQFTQLPWDYLHPNHAGYNAMGSSIEIAPFAPRRHGEH
jgi:lysophospholipase L1-like esterase